MQPRVDHADSDTAEYVTFDELAARFYEEEPRTMTHAEFGAPPTPARSATRTRTSIWSCVNVASVT